MSFVDANARVVFRSGGADHVAVKAVIHFLRRETAPTILAANKKNFQRLAHSWVRRNIATREFTDNFQYEI